MSGPLAFTTALLGGPFGFLFVVAGSVASTASETWSFRLVRGLWLLGSVVGGVIAFLRANRERS